MTEAELTALVERVERASGPDREIDRHIMSISYVWGERYIGCQCWDDGHDMCCPGGRHIEHVWIDPKTDQWKTTAREGYEFTSSLDAVIALIERELPEYRWGVHEHKGFTRAYVCKRGPLRPMPFTVAAQTPALALLAAFLRAKLSQASE